MATFLAQAALTLAQQHGYARGEAHAHVQYGLANFYRGNNQETVKAYLEALKTYENRNVSRDLTYGLVMVRLAAIFHTHHRRPGSQRPAHRHKSNATDTLNAYHALMAMNLNLES